MEDSKSLGYATQNHEYVILNQVHGNIFRIPNNPISSLWWHDFTVNSKGLGMGMEWQVYSKEVAKEEQLFAIIS